MKLSLDEQCKLHKEKKLKKNIFRVIKHKDEVNPKGRLVRSCKKRAIKHGYSINITPDDLIIPSHCPYLGIPLTNIMGRDDSIQISHWIG